MEVYALAYAPTEEIIGLATLANNDPDSFQTGPEIAGVWVRPDCRRSEDHIGLQLLEALARYGLQHYKTQPHVFGVSEAGRLLVDKALQAGIPLSPAWGGGTGEEEFD